MSREGSKWRAELSVDGKTFDCGLHDYEHEAAQVYTHLNVWDVIDLID